MERLVSTLARHLADKRQHLLFLVSLVTLLVLGAWWTILLTEKTREVYQGKVEREKLMTRLTALEMAARGATAPPPDSGLEVVPADAAPTRYDAPIRPGLVLRPRAARIDAIEREHRLRDIQVKGEGSLLILLILVSVFMLYYLLLVEGSVRRSMENFLSTVTHELKTPVAGIKALLQTLSMRQLPEDRQRHFLDMGLREASRLEHLVDNVLVANRLARKRMTIALQAVDLAPLLSREVEKRSQVLPSPDQLTLECGPSLVAAADPEAVGIVVENLIDNAFKYSGGDPRIVVKAEKSNGEVRIDVRDNGIGIEPGDMAHIFDPFYRATEKGVKAIKGTGLGLHIARSLARSVGGDVLATSGGRGQGSVFTVRLKAWP